MYYKSRKRRIDDHEINVNRKGNRKDIRRDEVWNVDEFICYELRNGVAPLAA